MLDHYQTKQELVIILPPGPMLAQKFPNGFAFEQIVHRGAVVQEQLGEVSPDGGPKPGVHYIDGKAALLSLEDPRRQITLANLPVEPFPRATPNF